MNIDLNAIEARAKAATRGPWYEEGWFTENEDGDYVEIEPADAAFSAHAREDIPALLAEVKRQAAELAAVTAERDDAVRHMKIIADTYRENVGDDGICGLCEYDAYNGIEGYANECPGFESNECFSWRGAGKEQNDGK